MIFLKESLTHRAQRAGRGRQPPFLDAMVPAFAKAMAAERPVRSRGSTLPNGIDMRNWTPEAEGRSALTKSAAPRAGQERSAGAVELTPIGDGRCRMALATMAAMASTTGVQVYKTAGADLRCGISPTRSRPTPWAI
jgi:hypothetical protein